MIPNRGAADICTLEARGTPDLVIGIATSGRTPYVLGAVLPGPAPRRETVGLACNRPQSARP